MTKVLIFEDEPASLRRLLRMIHKIRADWEIVATADSVVDALKLLDEVCFDLLITDIQLSDGPCFDILVQKKISQPILFITAYDSYALEAFNYHSIHYLLKPVNLEALHQAFLRFESIIQVNKENTVSTPRLLSKVGHKTVLIDPAEIAIVFTKDKLNKAVLFSGKTHLLELSLDTLQSGLEDMHFFRVNRQCIVQKKAIASTKVISSNRLALALHIDFPETVVVSKKNTPVFKKWLVDL